MVLLFLAALECGLSLLAKKVRHAPTPSCRVTVLQTKEAHPPGRPFEGIIGTNFAYPIPHLHLHLFVKSSPFGRDVDLWTAPKNFFADSH
jgi:hypothetical protein